MSGEEKGKGVKETIADEVKGIAVEVYKDVAKPMAVPIGATLGSAVKLVLWPVRTALDSANAVLDKLSARVEKRLEGVPTERRQLPPATLAGPTALQYALLGEGNEVADLREMFENLLVGAMDRQTAAAAHPAFVSMISQMTPDEARVLRSIDRVTYEYVELRSEQLGSEQQGQMRTMLGVDTGINEHQLDVYISNLVRLGVIKLHTGLAGSCEDAHPDLLKRLKAEFPDTEPRNLIRGGALLFMQVTALGLQFLKACLSISPVQS